MDTLLSLTDEQLSQLETELCKEFNRQDCVVTTPDLIALKTNPTIVGILDLAHNPQLFMMYFKSCITEVHASGIFVDAEGFRLLFGIIEKGYNQIHPISELHLVAKKIDPYDTLSRLIEPVTFKSLRSDHLIFGETYNSKGTPLQDFTLGYFDNNKLGLFVPLMHKTYNHAMQKLYHESMLQHV